MSITRILAEYIVDSSRHDVPQVVRHEAVRSFFNWVGCAIGGCRHDAVARAVSALGPFAGSEQATLLGRDSRSDALSAALINGISGHVLDFDDAQPRNTNINPSCSVAPAALALGEHLGAPGSEVLHAFLLGLEVECRIANAIYAKGSTRWFANSTAGVFGAAATAGKLLDLDSRRMAWALGIAATQSSGLRISFGTMCKALDVGRAARNGLTAALLARSGFTSSEKAIEAPRGFAQVFWPGSDPAPIVENLGRAYEVSYNIYKPFACGIVLHAPIDGCIQVRNENSIDPTKIARVELTVNPAVIDITGNPAPASGLESKFSVFHSAAVALIDGAAGELQFSDERVAAPLVLRLRSRITATKDASLARDAAHVRIVMDDGRVFEKTVRHALGSLRNPLSDRQLEEKFRSLTQGILTHGSTDTLIDLCWSITDIGDTSRIARAASGRSA
jgi:2-methylcitrate dehydratase PrpD